MKKNKSIIFMLIIICLLLIIISILSFNIANINSKELNKKQKEKIVNKLEGCWQGYAEDKKTKLYLIFKENNKVKYGGYTTGEYYDYKILSKYHMEFNGSTWNYELIGDDILIHWTNKYKRVSCDNKFFKNKY